MTRKTYRIGIGIALVLIVVVSVYLLYQEKQREKEYEDGVLVRIEKRIVLEEELEKEVQLEVMQNDNVYGEGESVA